MTGGLLDNGLSIGNATIPVVLAEKVGFLNWVAEITYPDKLTERFKARTMRGIINEAKIRVKKETGSENMVIMESSQ